MCLIKKKIFFLYRIGYLCYISFELLTFKFYMFFICCCLLCHVIVYNTTFVSQYINNIQVIMNNEVGWSGVQETNFAWIMKLSRNSLLDCELRILHICLKRAFLIIRQCQQQSWWNGMPWAAPPWSWMWMGAALATQVSPDSGA
jgi:hypothetical protein